MALALLTLTACGSGGDGQVTPSDAGLDTTRPGDVQSADSAQTSSNDTQLDAAPEDSGDEDAVARDSGAEDAPLGDVGDDVAFETTFTVPDGAVVTVGAARCQDAPALTAPALLDIPPGDGAARFVRLVANPGVAVGLRPVLLRPYAEDGVAPLEGSAAPTACATCEDFDSLSAPSACVAPGVPPQRERDGLHRPTGRALLANPTEAPREALLALPQQGGVYALVTFPLRAAPTEADCEGGAYALPPGVALAEAPPCPIAVTLAPRSRGEPFGVFYRNASLWTNPTADPAPAQDDAPSPPFAWLEEALAPSAACDTAPRLTDGDTLLARVDTEGFGSGLCAVDITGRGSGYAVIAVPARSRARLTARSAIVADGGGYPVLLLADACDPQAPCGATHSPEGWTTPLRVSIENPTDAEQLRRVAVMQGGPGYEGNVVELSVRVEPL